MGNEMAHGVGWICVSLYCFFSSFVLQFAYDCVLDCTMGNEMAHGVGLDLCVFTLFLLKLCVTICMGLRSGLHNGP